MNFTNLKMYPLPSGEFIVSYLDNSQRKRIQKKFVDESLARDFHQSLREEGLCSRKKHESNVGHLLRIYLKEKPESYLNQSGTLVREFLSAFEMYSPENLTEISLRTFLIQLKQENDYSDKTMLVAKSRLQGFFRYLIENDLLSQSPLENVKFDRGAPYRRKPIIISKPEMKDFIQKAKKFSPAMFYPIFVLIHETAAKTSDLIKLQWKDLNLKTRALHLNRSTELQPRNYIMSDELITALRRIEPVSDYVFTNLECRPLQKHILSRELKRLQRQMKWSTTWGLNDLRSSFAAHYLQNGKSIKSLQKIMGHKSFHNTEVVYGRYRIATSTESTETA